MQVLDLIPYVVSAAVVVLAVVMTVQSLFEEQLRVRRERRVREGGRRAELAAFEASLEAPEFEPAAPANGRMRERGVFAARARRLRLRRRTAASREGAECRRRLDVGMRRKLAADRRDAGLLRLVPA